MSDLLVVWVAANMLFFAAIAVWAFRTMRRTPSRGLLQMCLIIGSVSGLYSLSAVQRIVLQTARARGDLDEGFWALTWGQVALSAAGTLIVVVSLPVLRDLNRQIPRLELALQTFAGRLPSSATQETWNLTPREHDVMRVLQEGKTSDAEIAAVLFISPHTAGTHIRNILKKTGLSDRRQLLIALSGDERPVSE